MCRRIGPSAGEQQIERNVFCLYLSTIVRSGIGQACFLILADTWRCFIWVCCCSCARVLSTVRLSQNSGVDRWPVTGQSCPGRCHPRPLQHRLRASAAAPSPPPPSGGQQHPQQSAVTPLGMLDSAIAVPAVSHETRDDGGITSTTSGGEAPVGAPQERREKNGDDGGKEEEGGKARRRSKRSKSVRQFFRRTSSHVLSYLTIMTTWVLFRFLLKGLNKVNRCA